MFFKIDDSIKKLNKCYADLPNLCSNLRLQKLTRANENFSWNIRLLKTQLTLIQKTSIEVNDIIFQVK